jgi:DNA repair exonuclease SbcCD nuclease subunit
MLRGVSTSDWHLDGGLSNVFKEKALPKMLHELDKIFKYCVENDIHHLFMSGDISDKARLDEETFIALVTLLLKYDQYVNFYYLLGNHDVAHVGRTSIDVLRIFAENGGLKNVRIFSKPEVITIDGIEVGFVPFPYTQLETKDKTPKLIFAHIEEAGAIGDNGHPLKSQHLKLLRSKDDFVFSGHLHTYQVMKDRRIVFQGAPYQKNFGEQGKKGFVEFKARYSRDGDLQVKPTFVDNRPEFTLINLAINEDADFDKIERNENMLYKITLGEGVIAPKGITRDFPNIIMLNGVSYKGRSNIDTSEKMSAEDIPKITPLTGLVKYLHKYELEKAEVKRAVSMVKEAIAFIQNNGVPK